MCKNLKLNLTVPREVVAKKQKLINKEILQF